MRIKNSSPWATNSSVHRCQPIQDFGGDQWDELVIPVTRFIFVLWATGTTMVEIRPSGIQRPALFIKSPQWTCNFNNQ